MISSSCNDQGPNTGKGTCQYKMSMGTFFASTGIYGGAYLISNGTPQQPVSIQFVVRKYSAHVHLFNSVPTTTKRHTPTSTASFTKSTAAMTAAAQPASVHLAQVAWQPASPCVTLPLVAHRSRTCILEPSLGMATQTPTALAT